MSENEKTLFIVHFYLYIFKIVRPLMFFTFSPFLQATRNCDQKNRCLGREKFAVLTIDGQARLLTVIHPPFVQCASPFTTLAAHPPSMPGFFSGQSSPLQPHFGTLPMHTLVNIERIAFEGIDGPLALDIPK